MGKTPQRPQGMSQLDYLWLNFGGYEIGNAPSSIPQQNVVLNELAVTSLIKNATNGGILSLEYAEHPTNPELMRLVGKSVEGQPISFIDMPKEVHVQSFVGRTVSQVDIDNGCSYPFGTKVISIVLTNGKEYLVSLDSLGLVLQGAETKSTISEIRDGKVYNHVKVDKISLSVIELKETSYGISAHLNISPDKTGVRLENASNGLKAGIQLGDTNNYIKFDRMSLNAYMALANKDDFTVYFITDKPYIFVGSQKYGVDAVGDSITSLRYNRDKMTLTYDSPEGEETLMLGPASSTQNGMLSKTDYVEFQKLRTALNGITDVKQYLKDETVNLGTTIAYGDVEGNKRPLHLKNSKGDILGTVWTDVETYLARSESRQATANDVVEASQVGVTIEEGDRIIILVLTNGDKHFIKLQDLVAAQSFKNSKTINFTTSSDKSISANLNIDTSKILYITDTGLAANIQIKKDGKFIKLYGQTTSEEHLIGKFYSPEKELVSTLFVPNVSDFTLQQYPAHYVDWKKDDKVVNGNDYLLLFYLDPNTNEIFNYYITIPKAKIGISNIEGNLLKKDANGDLYVLFEWIETN